MLKCLHYTGLWRTALFFLCLEVCFISARAGDASGYFQYWNFNATGDLITPTQGNGLLEFSLAGGSELISGTGQDFAGTNVRNGDAVGAHLRLNNPIGSTLTFRVPTTGYTGVIFKYETRRSGSGAGTQQVSYSLDGSTFIPWQTVVVQDAIPQLVTFDFSSIPHANDNPNFALRFTFEQGAGGAVGNNRFDNVTLEGEGDDDGGPGVVITTTFPVNDATRISQAPTFRWAGDEGPFQLQVSTDKDFTTVELENENLTEKEHTFPDKLAGSTTYYWRVGLKHEEEQFWSDVQRFTTESTSGASDPSISYFAFEAVNNIGKLDETIVCDIYGDSAIVGIIPFAATDLHLAPTFTTRATTGTAVNGVLQESQWTVNNYSTPLVYTLSADGQTRKKYTVTLVYTGLPVVYVNTVDQTPVISKDDYVSGQVKIYPTDGSNVFSASMQIKGRGNSTWGLPKKPYRIKLDTKASVLGFPADKDWVLLANYSDKTLIRNYLAFELGNDFGFEYTNRTQPVEVVLNGVYVGSYLLAEQVKVSKDRVNIKELDEDDDSDDKITGGYLLEVDARLDEEFWFRTSSGTPFTLKSPEDTTPEQLEYIKNYIQGVEDVLFSDLASDPDEGYAKYINPETFIQWYWVNEIFKNNDAIFFSSVFMYKDRDEKLSMGPLWDFDIAAGNVDYNDNDNPSGWWIRKSAWMTSLFKDPAFRQAAEAFWNSKREDMLTHLFSRIDERATYLHRSEEQNFKKWPILDTYVWPNAVVTGSYANEVSYLKKWLAARIHWIDAQINPVSTTPFRLLQLPDGSRRVVNGDVGNKITLQWESAGPGVSYRVEVSRTEAGFSKPVLLQYANLRGYGLSADLSSQQLVDLLDNLRIEDKDSVVLYWKVFAFSADDDSLSSDQTFHLKLVKNYTQTRLLVSPPAVKVTLPAKIVAANDLHALVEWDGEKSEEDAYILEVSLYENFSDIMHQMTNLNEASYLLDSLQQGTVYYVRVKVLGFFNESEWSQTVSFKTDLITAIEAGADHSFTIYPNPTFGQVIVEYEPMAKPEYLEVRDMIGRKVLSSFLTTGNRVVVDLSALPKGVYVFVLKQGTRVMAGRKVVVY